MSFEKKIVHGTGIVFGTTFGVALLSYLIRVLLARELSVENYGLVYSVIALFGIFGIFVDMGLNSAITKYVAEFNAKNKLGLSKNCYLLAFIVQLLLSSIIGLTFITFSRSIASTYLSTTHASGLIILFSVYFILLPIISLTKSMYIAFHKPIFYGILEIGQYGFILVVTYLLIKFGQRISSVFIGYASFAIIGSVVSIMILRKYVFKQFSEHKFSFKTGLLKKVISFGLFMLVYNLFNLFFGKIDMVLLTVFRNLSEVGIYSVVLPTTMAISNLCSSFILVLLPVTSEMWASKLYKQLKKNIKKLYLFCLVIGLPVAISLYFYSSLIIKTLFTDKYLNGTLTLQLLSFNFIHAN